MPASSGDPQYQHCVFLFGLLQLAHLYCSTWPICHPLLMQHFRPTLTFKPLTLLPLTLYLFSLHPFRPLMFLAVFLHVLLPLLLLTRSEFFNGMLEVFEPEALNCYSLSRLIMLTLSVSSNPTLTHLPLSKSLDFLLCDLTTPTPDLTFFFPMPPRPASSLSSGSAYPSLNFLPPLSLFARTLL